MWACQGLSLCVNIHLFADACLCCLLSSCACRGFVMSWYAGTGWYEWHETRALCAGMLFCLLEFLSWLTLDVDFCTDLPWYTGTKWYQWCGAVPCSLFVIWFGCINRYQLILVSFGLLLVYAWVLDSASPFWRVAGCIANLIVPYVKILLSVVSEFYGRCACQCTNTSDVICALLGN
jgi:hypothetical protein